MAIKKEKEWIRFDFIVERFFFRFSFLKKVKENFECIKESLKNMKLKEEDVL
jgi:hypothetical protein